MIKMHLDLHSRQTWLGDVALVLLTLFFLGMFLSGCSNMSKLPDKENVKVSRKKPDADDKCEDLGPVTGRTLSTKGTAQEALDDMVQEAANKGANFLFVNQYSAQQTAVTGIAYRCP
jgi:hypothetical protein